jgi:hypothetical protein
MLWRVADAARDPSQRLLAGAFALTACWAWLAAVAPVAPVFGFAESAEAAARARLRAASSR